MNRKDYEKELRKLQIGLCRPQDWVKHKGLRVIIVFEGRDAAGKGGTIKVITERVSPRIFRVVALPSPSDREKSQMFMQRYIRHFPAAGEVVIFDRSWYNRVGVEYVMGSGVRRDAQVGRSDGRSDEAPPQSADRLVEVLHRCTNGAHLCPPLWLILREYKTQAERHASKGQQSSPRNSLFVREPEFARLELDCTSTIPSDDQAISAISAARSKLQ